MTKKKFDFRDVSTGVQMLRRFLLGRKHILHGRFTPAIAPRTIPPADVPRGPEIKYANKYYFQRSAFNSIQPPVVAPVAEGPPILKDPTKKSASGGIRPDAICFNNAPTPGPTWWWDGHSFYECLPDPPPPSSEHLAQEDPYCPKPETSSAQSASTCPPTPIRTGKK